VNGPAHPGLPSAMPSWSTLQVCYRSSPTSYAQKIWLDPRRLYDNRLERRRGPRAPSPNRLMEKYGWVVLPSLLSGRTRFKFQRLIVCIIIYSVRSEKVAKWFCTT
jgi:hypothetical protein